MIIENIDKGTPVWVPQQYLDLFEVRLQKEIRVDVPFTREGWHGRMRGYRGVGALMSEEVLAAWDQEHRKILEETAPERFEVKHYISVAGLEVRDGTYDGKDGLGKPL